MNKIHGNHGLSKTKIYSVWNSLRNRCNPNTKGWERYKEKGITICPEWNDPLEFIEWSLSNGYKEGLQIDRIDNTKGYSPDNCRWVDCKTNQNNRSDTIRLEYNGEVKPLQEWASITGMCPNLIRSRIKVGWSVEKALNTPVNNHERFEYNGESKTTREWSKITNIDSNIIHRRIKELGWTVERALTTPPIKRRKSNKNQ